MKTLNDLEQMKTEKSIPFRTQYDYFLARLEDYFISKSDGLSRIISELSQWDDEAQKAIISKLVDTVYYNGTTGLDREEIAARLRWSLYNAE